MNSIKLNVHLEILLSSLQEYTQILIRLDTFFQEGRYAEACQKFQTAMNILGYQPGVVK